MTDPYAPFFIVTSEPDLDSKRFNTLEEAVVWAALDHYAESYCLEIHADYQRPISNFMGMVFEHLEDVRDDKRHEASLAA